MTELEQLRAENRVMARALEDIAHSGFCPYGHDERAHKALAQSPKSLALVEVERAKEEVCRLARISRHAFDCAIVIDSSCDCELSDALANLAEAKRKAGLE